MVNESWANSDYYYKVNVLSKISLIKSICKYNFLKKYIYISTPEIFGSSKNLLMKIVLILIQVRLMQIQNF